MMPRPQLKRFREQVSYGLMVISVLTVLIGGPIALAAGINKIIASSKKPEEIWKVERSFSLTAMCHQRGISNGAIYVVTAELSHNLTKGGASWNVSAERPFVEAELYNVTHTYYPPSSISFYLLTDKEVETLISGDLSHIEGTGDTNSAGSRKAPMECTIQPRN